MDNFLIAFKKSFDSFIFQNVNSVEVEKSVDTNNENNYFPPTTCQVVSGQFVIGQSKNVY